MIKKNIKIRSIGFVNPNQTAAKVYVLRVSTGILNTVADLDHFESSLKEVLKTI
ncbi:MAG: selenocysteine lyase/cysteine desulfurase [Pseudohongiellaceae bacterium]